MEPALTAAVEPVRHVRGIKNKDINPVCSLSLSPGRSSSDLPGCLRGTSVSPETRSVCLLSRAQKGPPLRRSRASVQLCCTYPPSSKASARTSAVTITDSQAIKTRSSKSQSVTRTSTGSFLRTFAPQLVQFDVKVLHFQTNEKKMYQGKQLQGVNMSFQIPAWHDCNTIIHSLYLWINRPRLIQEWGGIHVDILQREHIDSRYRNDWNEFWCMAAPCLCYSRCTQPDNYRTVILFLLTFDSGNL